MWEEKHLDVVEFNVPSWQQFGRLECWDKCIYSRPTLSPDGNTDSGRAFIFFFFLANNLAVFCSFTCIRLNSNGLGACFPRVSTKSQLWSKTAIVQAKLAELGCAIPVVLVFQTRKIWKCRGHRGLQGGGAGGSRRGPGRLVNGF